MTYKELLLKINTLPEDIQAAARKKALQGKIDKIPAASVWDMLQTGTKNPDQEKNFDSTKQKQDHAEKMQGDIIGGSVTVSDAGGLDMAEIEQKIENTINDFCIRYEIDGIQGLRKAKQTTWNSLCIYIGQKCFKGSDILKDKTLKQAGCTMSTCGRYDINKIADILHYCYYLCGLYDKAFTWWTGAAFCGLNEDFISDHAEQLTRAGFPVLKNTENSLNMAMLSAASPMAFIATLNHRFGWSNPAAASAPASVNVAVYPVLSAAAVPSLPDNDKM